MGNHAVATYKNLEFSFEISQYDQPTTLGEFIRVRRFENDLTADDLADLIGVTEDTILNWEKGRTYPCQRDMLRLKQHLKLDPF